MMTSMFIGMKGSAVGDKPKPFSEAWYVGKVAKLRAKQPSVPVTAAAFKSRCQAKQRIAFDVDLFNKVTAKDYQSPYLQAAEPMVIKVNGHYWFNPKANLHLSKEGGYPRVMIPGSGDGKGKKGGDYVVAHGVIYRWYAGMPVPVGHDVSHRTDQPRLADPSTFLVELGSVNRARTACRLTDAYLRTHPRSMCAGKPLAACIHPNKCPDACFHNEICMAQIPMPDLYTAARDPPAQSLDQLRIEFPRPQ